MPRATSMVGCHCLHGWICEAHADRPWPHDDCPGAGAPCENFDCPWWKGPSPAALSTEHWEQVVSARNRRAYSERRENPQSARRNVSRGGRRATDSGDPYPRLLVADSHREALVYVRYLKRFGFAVQALVDGLELLPAIQATRPHAILMEPSLPSMPAWRLAERLAEDAETRETPIILMIGNVPAESDSPPPGVRVAGRLLKPFPRASMLEEVRRVLRLHPPPPPASST